MIMAAGVTVSKEIKDTIKVTIDEVFEKMNSISWLERQKAMTEETFKNTEKILYSYTVLKEHVEDEKKYIDESMAELHKSKSKSIVVYSTAQKKEIDEDLILENRKAAYRRSKADFDRVTKALNKVKKKKGYEVIEYRYLKRKENEDVYTYEEIADLLSGKKGYGENLNEKTVRNYKNKLVKEVAIFLFGSDAI